MQHKFDICMVIPCYNEGKHFLLQRYIDYTQAQPKSLLCFVNDGSSDDTEKVLLGLQQKFSQQVAVISYAENQGKAEAVRRGILHCYAQFDFDCIAYLDADLAVSLEECQSLIKYLNDDINFCFGSRIQRIGSMIERKRSRFLIGRFIATIISQMLDLRVYDTQCGCKLFTKPLASLLFDKPFISRWLFDVEIFFRILTLYGKEKALKKMLEVPLIRWVDPGDSKVKLSYFYKLWVDLYRIKKAYRK